ncbi:MAG TPA: lysophospholipid acyltransferase family protein [Chloroflexia bacterium]|nr:lysophospholipid acyltransferase family protein [Chloroflexia bacterium]
MMDKERSTLEPTSRVAEHLQAGNAGRARVALKAFRAVIRLLFSIIFSVRVRGLKNVPRIPVIVCANHLGWTDPFLVLLYLPVEPRVYILGEHQVKEISGFRTRMINWMEVMVPLERTRPREAMTVMEQVVRRGGSLLLFPEGRLGTEEGTLGELQHGAARLSVATGAPLLPIGLTGTSQLWIRRRLWVRIGEPIYPTAFEGDDRGKTRSMTAELALRMKRLLPGDRQQARVKLLKRWLTKLF